MRHHHPIMTLPAAGVILLLLLSGCSSSKKDPMDPYRNLGAPDGFQRDTYNEKVGKQQKLKKEKEKKKKSDSVFPDFFGSDETKRSIRDVSRPMQKDSFEVFPWRSGESRSSRLHDSIREENNRKDPLYW